MAEDSFRGAAERSEITIRGAQKSFVKLMIVKNMFSAGLGGQLPTLRSSTGARKPKLSLVAWRKRFGVELLIFHCAHKPSAATCSSVSKPSQCATSCQTTRFTSSRKSPFEHRRMGPRKTKIKSGAYCTCPNERFVLNIP